MSQILGTHLIIDLWGAKNIVDVDVVSEIFKKGVEELGVTLLKIDLHDFGNGGVSGVALLAESHISIHTWPEHDGYAAIDVFVCNGVDPYKLIPILKKEFEPTNVDVTEIKRGIKKLV
jgi:S-adenosylmethionine decarboxylase